MYGEMSANMATLKISGRKSQTNTVTMEGSNVGENPNHKFTQTGRWFYTHTNTRTLKQIYGGVLLQDPPRSRTTIEVYTEESSLVWECMLIIFT